MCMAHLCDVCLIVYFVLLPRCCLQKRVSDQSLAAAQDEAKKYKEE